MNPWYRRMLAWFGGESDEAIAESTGGEKPIMSAQMLINGVMKTRPDELDCGECFEQLDRFAEIRITGGDAAALMPLVQDHLDRCPDCREEYEALLLALQANA